MIDATDIKMATTFTHAQTLLKMEMLSNGNPKKSFPETNYN